MSDRVAPNYCVLPAEQRLAERLGVDPQKLLQVLRLEGNTLNLTRNHENEPIHYDLQNRADDADADGGTED